uniref:Uncharacterized protein n=1 Tax=Rhizophora mucronata TaxID=61149 RepID=A0A2P2IYC9_RHIMU
MSVFKLLFCRTYIIAIVFLIIIIVVKASRAIKVLIFSCLILLPLK